MEAGEASHPFGNPSVLFVCTANRIRSPLAAILFRNLLQQEGFEPHTWRIESAGTWAIDGLPVFDEVEQLLTQRGLPSEQHISRSVTEKMIANHNLVLVMEPGHQEALKAEFPKYAHRIHLLSEMSSKRAPVEDPAGGLLVDYEATAKEIEGYLYQGLARILYLAYTPG